MTLAQSSQHVGTRETLGSEQNLLPYSTPCVVWSNALSCSPISSTEPEHLPPTSVDSLNGLFGGGGFMIFSLSLKGHLELFFGKYNCASAALRMVSLHFTSLFSESVLEQTDDVTAE
ncbi:hypothetical protein JZ751_003396, partial [Albula glossodonta]